MGFGKDHPPKPFTCEWYKLHPQFGQCPDEVPGADIQSDLFTLLIVAGILYYMLIIFKLIKPFSFSFKRNNNLESKT